MKTCEHFSTQSCMGYLCSRDCRANFSAHLSLTKGLVEVLIRLYGHGQDGAVGMAQLCAVGQLVEGHVLLEQRRAKESVTFGHDFGEFEAFQCIKDFMSPFSLMIGHC